MSEHYVSLEECVIDIMANTDAPFMNVEPFAHFVFDHGWTYDNGDTPRSVRFISPSNDGQVIEVSYQFVTDFGDKYLTLPSVGGTKTRIDQFNREDFTLPEEDGRPYCANTENGVHLYAPEIGCAKPMKEDHA